jgi:hypothetical protein
MKKKKQTNRITTEDYIKAVKKADRELSLQNSIGFRATTKVHQSKKAYKRKEGKKIDFDTLFFLCKTFVCTPIYSFAAK